MSHAKKATGREAQAAGCEAQAAAGRGAANEPTARLSAVAHTLAAAVADTSGPLVLMVSGGSDSTALAYAAAELRAPGGALDGQLVALLHVNHCLRGSAADADEQFVRELAELLSLPAFVHRRDVAALAAAQGENVEAAGREARYQAAAELLAQLRKENRRNASDTPDQGAALTAHTLDDRIENFYMRSIVGTGPGGLRAMRPLSVATWDNQQLRVLRPLLGCTRVDLRASIAARAEAGLPVARTAAGALWCDDATNAVPDHFRTFVRHAIVPRTREWSAGAPRALQRTMDLIADEDDYLEEQAQALLTAHVRFEHCASATTAPTERSALGVEAPCVPQPLAAAPQNATANTALLAPAFGTAPLVLQRRAAFSLLQGLLRANVDPNLRIENATVQALLAAWNAGVPCGGYVRNIQGNYVISANKHGVRIEPMAAFRARRKRS